MFLHYIFEFFPFKFHFVYFGGLKQSIVFRYTNIYITLYFSLLILPLLSLDGSFGTTIDTTQGQRPSLHKAWCVLSHMLHTSSIPLPPTAWTAAGSSPLMRKRSPPSRPLACSHSALQIVCMHGISRNNNQMFFCAYVITTMLHHHRAIHSQRSCLMRLGYSTPMALCCCKTSSLSCSSPQAAQGGVPLSLRVGQNSLQVRYGYW